MHAVLRYLARRLVLTIPVLLGVATLVFSLIHLIPGDPAQAILGETAPQADVDELRRRLGLDRPLVEQYGGFLSGLVRGDLGMSLRTGEPVVSQVAARVPATAELAAAAMLVAVAVALPLGIAAAVWRGTAIDTGATALAVAAPSRGRVPPSLLPARIREQQPRPPTLAAVRAACEREAVRAALARAAGCRAGAARELGLTRQGLLKTMRRLALFPFEAQPR